MEERKHPAKGGISTEGYDLTPESVDAFIRTELSHLRWHSRSELETIAREWISPGKPFSNRKSIYERQVEECIQHHAFLSEKNSEKHIREWAKAWVKAEAIAERYRLNCGRFALSMSETLREKFEFADYYLEFTTASQDALEDEKLQSVVQQYGLEFMLMLARRDKRGFEDILKLIESENPANRSVSVTAKRVILEIFTIYLDRHKTLPKKSDIRKILGKRNILTGYSPQVEIDQGEAVGQMVNSHFYDYLADIGLGGLQKGVRQKG